MIGLPSSDDLLLSRATQQVVVIPDQLQLGLVGIASRGSEEHSRHRNRRAGEQRLGAFDGDVGGHAVEGMEERKLGALCCYSVRNLAPAIAQVDAPQARHSVEIFLAVDVLDPNTA